jgi:hypothetical protein
MNDDLPEPLDDELRSLFAAEARFPEAPEPERARVWQRLESVLALPPISALPEATPSAHVTAAKAGAAVGLGKLASVGIVTFALGGLSGAGVYHALVESRAPVVIQVPVPAPAPSLAASAPVSDAGVPGDAAVVQALAPPADERRTERVRRPRHVEEATSPSQLARERAIIDVVRAAIARGHADSALEAVARHASEFPTGRLREEREGLRVLALVRAGRVQEARAAAARFKQEYPASLLWPALERALAAGR